MAIKYGKDISAKDIEKNNPDSRYVVWFFSLISPNRILDMSMYSLVV
jgi:hypothetical protein